MADEQLRVDFILALPRERVVLIGRVDDIKLDWAAHANAGAVELYGASAGVKHWSRPVGVAATTADVVRVFQLKVTVWHLTATSHAEHWALTARLQVGNTDTYQHNNSCSQHQAMHQCLYSTARLVVTMLIIIINDTRYRCSCYQMLTRKSYHECLNCNIRSGGTTPSPFLFFSSPPPCRPLCYSLLSSYFVLPTSPLPVFPILSLPSLFCFPDLAFSPINPARGLQSDVSSPSDGKHVLMHSELKNHVQHARMTDSRADESSVVVVDVEWCKLDGYAC